MQGMPKTEDTPKGFPFKSIGLIILGCIGAVHVYLKPATYSDAQKTRDGNIELLENFGQQFIGEEIASYFMTEAAKDPEKFVPNKLKISSLKKLFSTVGDELSRAVDQHQSYAVHDQHMWTDKSKNSPLIVTANILFAPKTEQLTIEIQENGVITRSNTIDVGLAIGYAQKKRDAEALKSLPN
jgi:hypothetical protein